MPYGLIAIVDKSTKSGYDDTSGRVLAGALAHQAKQLGTAYNIVPQSVIWYGAHPELVPPTAWPVVILDDPDTAGALGYHALDPNGRPYGRVFVNPTLKAKYPVSSVISHEVLEAVCDPYANLWADGDDGVMYAFECCDPVESQLYSLDGVVVSNFVTRRWFDSSATTGPFDQLNKLTAPFQLSKGGYWITMQSSKWNVKFGSLYPEWRQELRKAAPQPSRSVWREVRLLSDQVRGSEVAELGKYDYPMGTDERPAE